MIIEIEPDKGATVSPTSPMTLDLSSEKEIIITAQDGAIKKYQVKAVVSPSFQVYPKYLTTVTELWSKTGTEMQLAFPGSDRGSW